MCRQLLANPLIEDYEIVRRAGTAREVRRRPLPRLLRRRRRPARGLARGRGRAAVARATATCTASTRSIVPGGFSYGDYLRVGAIARFSPVMESVIAFARDGGPVLGICNGFQVLCEAGLLPGALLPNDAPALPLPPGRRRGRQRRHRLHARVRGGRAAVDPVPSTRPAATTRPTTSSTRWRRAGRSSCATRRARTPTARCATSPACATRPATSSG